MARRRLSQHQKKRIDDAQQALTSANDSHQQGLVISHHGGKIIVEQEDSSLATCAVKSNLGAIVCGDQVIFEKTAENEFRVLAVKARDNLLQRLDGFGHVKSVAANITQLLICLAVKPEPNLFLLDQYLLSAEQQRIEPVIVLNKIELLDSTEDPYDLDSVYAHIGYKVIKISVKERLDLDQLKSVLDHNTTVLSGVSGVGKSSITSELLPDTYIKIAEISSANEEGRHTTRTSRLYHLPNNGQLIDTPGVRGFNPLLDPTQPVSAGFREIDQHSADCRFANCKHINEPKCAVIDAVKNKQIADSRYQHYLRMVSPD